MIILNINLHFNNMNYILAFKKHVNIRYGSNGIIENKKFISYLFYCTRYNKSCSVSSIPVISPHHLYITKLMHFTRRRSLGQRQIAAKRLPRLRRSKTLVAITFL